MEKEKKRKMATYPLRKYRLRGKEFEEVLKKGKGFRVNGLVLKLILKEKEKKFGFLISKKVLKKAVQRNKLKRRLREILRERVENIREGVRAVFIALRRIEEKEFFELKEIFEKILKKSKILKNESNPPIL
jgi:ribonuclease P protein component